MQTKWNMVSASAQQILEEMRQVIVGKDSVLLWSLAAILAGGHILLEDVPGVGKTTLALAFSRVLGLKYSRVQFTPDVLPSDITGYSVLDRTDGTMKFCPGAVFCNLFLADELNRATSRTQSALLEAMEEGSVTVDGKTYALGHPFVVIATQNPVGAAGTQLLPDSQLDRFLIRLHLGYPSLRDEMRMVMDRHNRNPLEKLQSLLTRDKLVTLQEQVAQTYVCEAVVEYLVNLVSKTREHSQVLQGASPRATLAVMAMAKAVARLRSRDYVVPQDVKEVFEPTLAHRLVLTPRAESQGITPEQILAEILGQVPAPKLR